ncbi:aminoacyl-tRNA deacylase and HDOD domain-containing protein [Saccharophagus degradans]|uniref:HDOD domain-containing protein n=1 Tax=Saccharophagus degradans TaxID=86304 RepID=A0AAW7XBZ1_9GAMM|nr:HDOD domain-containing protein [Saccharophagus degradans]MDO6423889.1 HDOD domain-containing protein [Saccharophagus degradans]MDO6607966.1 HDOD domain-containing protein [Saccharophagus degradans]
MSVNTSILEMLENRQVAYNITGMDEATKLRLIPSTNMVCIVKAVLVQDAKSRCQVLVPSNTIVDVDAMFRHFGRSFEGIPCQEISPLLEKQQLISVPAIPRWQGLPTLVDASILRYEKLLLESGDGERWVEVSQEDFQSIIDASSVGTFAGSMPSSDSAADDEAQIFDSVKRFTQLRIKQRLDETLELPPLPETAQRIIKLRADPNADISDLTNIVEIDPSLAAQVVSWAASPYYSAPGKIKSVHDAIVRVLGFDMVLNLALGLALGRTITSSAASQKQLDDYWRASVYSAAAVEGLVTSIGREHRPSFGMAYLSGLLNNFGFLVLAEVFPPYFSNISRLQLANPHVPNASVEQFLLGVSGNQVASWLLGNWNMPEEVIVALRQQNNLDFKGEHNVYSKLIYVAKQLLAEKGFGSSYPQALPDSLFQELHLDRETAEITIENILESGSDLNEIAEKMRG